jgi:hypothetical protein
MISQPDIAIRRSQRLPSGCSASRSLIGLPQPIGVYDTASKIGLTAS